MFDGARPTRPGDLTLETAGIVPIPEDARYGANWRNFTVWFAPNMELSGVFTGTLAATLGLGLGAGLAAIVVGVLLGAAPVAALSLWGPKTGMAQLPLARLPFGKSITVPALVQWISAVAWDGLVGLFGGEAAQILFHVPFAVGVLVVLALEGLIGFLGYEFIHRLEAWGAAILTVLFVILTFKVVEPRRLPRAQHGPRRGGGRDVRPDDDHRLQRRVQLGHLRRRLQPLHGHRHPAPAPVLVHLRRAGRVVPVGVHHRAARGQVPHRPDRGRGAGADGRGVLGILALVAIVLRRGDQQRHERLLGFTGRPGRWGADQAAHLGRRSARRSPSS